MHAADTFMIPLPSCAFEHHQCHMCSSYMSRLFGVAINRQQVRCAERMEPKHAPAACRIAQAFKERTCRGLYGPHLHGSGVHWALHVTCRNRLGSNRE